MADSEYQAAGAASLTLIDCLLTHLEEAGGFTAADRDALFENAVTSHEQADSETPDPAHAQVILLLKRLQARSDGLRVVGTGATKVAATAASGHADGV